MSDAEHKQDLRFPSASRLLQHAAFDRVYKEGRRIFSGNMIVFFRPREAGELPRGARVGFTVSRAMGGAVQRNRIKRRLREAVRLHLRAFTAPVDVVINPRKTTIRAEFAQLTAEVQRAFTQIQRAADKGGMADAEDAQERRGRPA